MRRKFRSIYWTWVYLLYSCIHVSEKNMYVFVNMSLQKYYNLLEILGWPKSSFICEMLWKNPNEFFGWQNITEQRPHHFSALGTGFMEDNFSMDWEVGGWFCKIQAHYIYCALYFYFVAVSWYSPWRRKWQPTPVFLPGKSHGWRRLAGYTVHGVSKSRTQLSNFTWLMIFYLDLWVPVHAPMRVSVTSYLVGGVVQTVMQPWGALWIHVCFRRTAQWFSYAY